MANLKTGSQNARKKVQVNLQMYSFKKRLKCNDFS